MNNNSDIGYALGLAILGAISIAILIGVAKAKKKRETNTENPKIKEKNTESPRAKKTIEKELKDLLNSEDGKVKGLLLAWCILTGCYIILGIFGNAGEISVWLQGLFILALLIMAIMGRGRWFIVIASALLSVFMFWGCATTTPASLRTSCAWSDWSRASQCYDVPDYVWENEARISKIGGAIGGSFYGITALYFAFSKRAKKHFAWGKRKAELWQELESLDNSEKTETESKPQEESDDEAELKALKEESKKLADKIDKLEQKTKKKGKE